MGSGQESPHKLFLLAESKEIVALIFGQHQTALEELKTFHGGVSLNQSCIRKAVWLTLTCWTELMLMSGLVGGAAEAGSAVAGSEFLVA